MNRCWPTSRNENLALACAGEPSDRILAATFARKAAGEIVERVVSRLAEAALEAVAAEYQADELMIVTITHSHEARRRSYELIAAAFELV